MAKYNWLQDSRYRLEQVAAARLVNDVTAAIPDLRDAPIEVVYHAAIVEMIAGTLGGKSLPVVATPATRDARGTTADDLVQVRSRGVPYRYDGTAAKWVPAAQRYLGVAVVGEHMADGWEGTVGVDRADTVTQAEIDANTYPNGARWRWKYVAGVDTRDYVCLQEAILDCITNYDSAVYGLADKEFWRGTSNARKGWFVPPGSYNITRPLFGQSMVGFHGEGRGRQASRIVQKRQNASALQVDGFTYSTLENMGFETVYGSGSAGLRHPLVDIDWKGGNTSISWNLENGVKGDLTQRAITAVTHPSVTVAGIGYGIAAGELLSVVDGTGAGQARIVLQAVESGGNTIIYIMSPWRTTPDATSRIVHGGKAGLVRWASGYRYLHNKTSLGPGTATTIKIEQGHAGDFFKGMFVNVVSGTGDVNSPKLITAYDSSTGVATIQGTWVTPPDGTTVYDVYSPKYLFDYDQSFDATDVGRKVWVYTRGVNVAHTNTVAAEIPAGVAGHSKGVQLTSLWTDGVQPPRPSMPTNMITSPQLGPDGSYFSDQGTESFYCIAPAANDLGLALSATQTCSLSVAGGLNTPAAGQFIGAFVRILDGAAAGQILPIHTHTDTTISFDMGGSSGPEGNDFAWAVPAVGDHFDVIGRGTSIGSQENKFRDLNVFSLYREVGFAYPRQGNWSQSSETTFDNIFFNAAGSTSAVDGGAVGLLINGYNALNIKVRNGNFASANRYCIWVRNGQCHVENVGFQPGYWFHRTAIKVDNSVNDHIQVHGCRMEAGRQLIAASPMWSGAAYQSASIDACWSLMDTQSYPWAAGVQTIGQRCTSSTRDGYPYLCVAIMNGTGDLTGQPEPTWANTDASSGSAWNPTMTVVAPDGSVVVYVRWDFPVVDMGGGSTLTNSHLADGCVGVANGGIVAGCWFTRPAFLRSAWGTANIADPYSGGGGGTATGGIIHYNNGCNATGVTNGTVMPSGVNSALGANRNFPFVLGKQPLVFVRGGTGNGNDDAVVVGLEHGAHASLYAGANNIPLLALFATAGRTPIFGRDVGYGTDLAGGDMIVAGGQGTGAGAGGKLKLQVAPAGGTGTNTNALVDAVIVNPDKSAELLGGTKIGGGDLVQLVKKYTPTLSPVAVAANTTAEQTFTVTGLTTNDLVFVKKPTAQAGLGIVGARVSAADTLAVTFSNNTAAPITPTAAEVYTVLALRI